MPSLTTFLSSNSIAKLSSVSGCASTTCLINIVLVSTPAHPSSYGGQDLRTYFPFVLLRYVYLFSSGGKTGAITIDSDRDYEVAIKALSKKNRDLCQVSVEFDTDCMEGFRIRKRVSIFFSFLNRIFTLFLS